MPSQRQRRIVDLPEPDCPTSAGIRPVDGEVDVVSARARAPAIVNDGDGAQLRNRARGCSIGSNVHVSPVEAALGIRIGRRQIGCS